jgi:hypothetical protein
LCHHLLVCSQQTAKAESRLVLVRGALLASGRLKGALALKKMKQSDAHGRTARPARHFFLVRSSKAESRKQKQLEFLLQKQIVVLGTISRKTSDSTDKFNGQNPLDIAVTNALELLRGQNFEN